MSEHLHAETIAAFAEGKLSRQEIAGVLAHLRRCPACTADVEAAQPRERTSLNRWLAAAAAAVVVIGALLFFTRDRRGDMSRLIALTRTDRIIEPRLSGGFAWAPYRGPARATVDRGDVDRMKVVGVAGEAADRARRDLSSDVQQTAGVAMLLAQRPEDAVAHLRRAAEQSPKDAGVWSDLAAAQLVAGTQLGQASLYSEALASADQALRIDAASSGALFNRALILERLGLHAAAAAAWDRYLRIDPSSPWANEARAHRSRVPATDINIDERYRRDAGRIERARELVANYPQQSRTFAEALHLGQWGEAEQRGDRGEADRQLALARAIGAALAESSGETLLRDAVAVIDASPNDRRLALARAHAAYYRGRLLYSRQQPTEAEALLRDAAAQFARFGSPMAFVAHYYAANAAFDRQQTAVANAELSALLREAHAHAGYIALGAQIRWELALCAMNDGAWSEALALLREAEAAFVRQREWENAASVQSLLATTLMASGKIDDGWASRIRAFDTLSRTGARHRLLVAVGGAVRMELRDRRLDAARAMLQIEEALCRDEGNAAMTADALLRDALLSEKLGDRALAESRVSEASAAAARISDAPLRARAVADVAFARGAIALGSSPAQARRHLSQAIDAYASVQHPLFLTEAYLLRARAAWAARDGDAAVLDLERGIAELEKHPVPLAGGVVGTGVLDAGHRLYEEAIRIHLARRDDERAFAYAERARSARVVSVDALKQLLAGTGAVILELVPAGDELVAFCVTENGLRVSRSPFDAARLPAMSDADRYDALLRPSSAALDRARMLVVVAGASLQNVAFAALVERASGQRLVQRFPVVIAPSAASLHALASPARPKSLLAIALPSGRDLSLALPDSDAEIADVARVYASAQLLAAERATVGSFAEAAGRADVIHIAGHTDQQASADDAAFVFAGGERMSPDRLSSLPIAAGGVVVLAGCNTLRASALRSVTLGDAFLAAGARAVIGTLTPINDRDARDLFAAFHRQLASGMSEAEALRRVQLDAIAAGRGDAWSSLALLTTAVPSTSRRTP
jgi:tetratricopeptide (TPR) repeat protein